MVNIFQNVPPLDWQTPIVNQDGTPSAQFIRIWRYAIENTDYTIDGLDGKVNKTGDTMTGVLEVDLGSGDIPDKITTFPILISNVDSVDAVVGGYGFGNSFNLRGFRANGTRATPTTIPANQTITGFYAQGWNGTTWNAIGAGVQLQASETYTPSANGSRVVILGTLNGATTSSVFARFDNGAFQMGGANTVITSDLHPQLRSYTTSGLPSASGRTGQLVYVSDAASGQQLQFSDGSSWLSGGGGGGGGGNWWFAPPVAADFPDVYSGDANNLALTDDGDVGLVVSSSPAAGGNIQRVATKSLPSAGATNWTATIRGTWTYPGVTSGSLNLSIYESATGRVAHIGWLSGAQIHAWRGNNLTSFTATIASFNRVITDYWLRIVYTHGTTTYSFQYSGDGKNWIVLGTVAAGTAFTTRADKVGFGSQAAAGFLTVSNWQQSW